MQVGNRARVVAVERPSPKDRTEYLDRDGLLVRRLNVPWQPDLGALWEVRFDDGTVEVFSESEIRQIGRDGSAEESEIPVLLQTWGEAPRRASLPFTRLGGGSGAALAVLAFLAFSIAGVLLVYVGLAQQNMLIAGAGAALVLIGMGAAAVLVS